MRQRFVVGVLVGMAFVVGMIWGRSQGAKPEPKLESVQAIIERVKLQNPDVPVRNFVQGEYLTVNLITPKTPLKPHYHVQHEEIAYVIRGHGKMRLGDEVKPTKAGDVMYIPKNVVHSFIPESDDCIALSVFAPAFDGKDRVFVEEK